MHSSQAFVAHHALVTGPAIRDAHRSLGPGVITRGSNFQRSVQVMNRRTLLCLYSLCSKSAWFTQLEPGVANKSYPRVNRSSRCKSRRLVSSDRQFWRQVAIRLHPTPCLPPASRETSTGGPPRPLSTEFPPKSLLSLPITQARFNSLLVSVERVGMSQLVSVSEPNTKNVLSVQMPRNAERDQPPGLWIGGKRCGSDATPSAGRTFQAIGYEAPEGTRTGTTTPGRWRVVSPPAGGPGEAKGPRIGQPPGLSNDRV